MCEENEIKICPWCGKAKPFDQFSPDSRMPDGLYYYCHSCESPRRRNHRQKLLHERNKFLADLKVKLGGCSVCHELFLPCLSFYRFDCKVNLNSLKYGKMEILQEELTHRVLLCANCYCKSVASH